MRPFTDVDAINAVCNHPSVRKWAMLPEGQAFDIAPILESGAGVFLGDARGGLLFVDCGEGVWEVHTQFLPHHRGPHATVTALRAFAWMFIRTNALEVTTWVSDDNRAARVLADSIGFVALRSEVLLGRDGTRLVYTIKQWARDQSCL